VTLASTTLEEAQVGQITSIACFPGTLAEVSAKLGAFPAPNTVTGNLIWTGPEQAFLLGAAPDLAGLAATTDQTGGWAALRLKGPKAADALMRLYPLDLRATHFPPDTCARSPLGHMQSILIHESDGFLILVFRSMARTAWHEIETALHALDARAVAGL
jgi:sarcosine oxidase subunit gamma